MPWKPMVIVMENAWIEICKLYYQLEFKAHCAMNSVTKMKTQWETVLYENLKVFTYNAMCSCKKKLLNFFPQYNL